MTPAHQPLPRKLAVPSSAPPVVQTEQLAKTYVLGFFRKKVAAIRDVTLQVGRGEIFGLLGPNGAGKTTTIKILLGLVRKSGGKASLLSAPPGDLAAKRRIGYLPEAPYFYDYLTGRELLTFVGKLFELRPAVGRERAAALLERVGLTHAADLPLRRYSKGMLQRVGLAQALLNDPELVILDEPLSGLDPVGRKQLREQISTLRDEGKTVVLSSHILSDVELLADRVAILVKGRTVDTGPLHELLDARVLSTELLLTGTSEALRAALAGAGHAVQMQGETARVELPGGASPDAVIDLVREHRGQIVSVTPRKESLEDVVVREIERSDTDADVAAAHASDR